MTTTVIIPAYNERKNIASIVRLAKKYVDEVVVVDDGSKDDTRQLAKQQGATVLNHPHNLGKGAALKTGCEYAYKKHKHIVLMDASSQHNPEDIPQFLTALKKYDIVYSKRDGEGKTTTLLSLGNKLFAWLSNVLFNVKLADTQSGFRAFKSKVYPAIRWKSTSYIVETEMIFRARKLSSDEISIAQTYKPVKARKVLTAIPIFLHLLKWKLFGF